MKIALCGNPNVGKTTLYNRLTRSSAPVGNWHGVTVDAVTKRIAGERDCVLSDLPGAYSLTARTSEETVTRDSVLFGDYDAIVYVAEINNLRRNLYCFLQILEANKRAVLVVNMLDEARGKVNLDLLSARLGVPVVGTSVRHKNPKAAIVEAARTANNKTRLPYLGDAEISSLAHTISARATQNRLNPEFAALKLIERDTYIEKLLSARAPESERCNACGGCENGDRAAELRYSYIDSILVGVYDVKRANRRTDRIDKVLLGKAALPIFLLIMAAVFLVTFELGKPLTWLIMRPIDALADFVREGTNMSPPIKSLLSDGVMQGVGAVLSFLPQVVLLYLLTAILQDSGYMSRVAFVTDDFFKRFGLSGRAAFSLILGLGCSATAVLTARGISDKTARRRTAFVTPYCPCSARLAVFTAITSYFGLSGFVIVALYLLGFVAALAVLKFMQAFGRSPSEESLLMEMPPYRRPSCRRVLKTVWDNVASFVLRVGSVVLAVGIIMWALGSFSMSGRFTPNGEGSILHAIASAISPIFVPLGFGDWRAVSALISGVAAKETVISVIASFGGAGAVFQSTAAAVSFLIFTALYVPCVATLAALAKENGAVSMLISVGVHTLIAYVSSLVFYTLSLCYDANRTLFIIITSCVLGAAAVITIVMRIVSHRKSKRKSNVGKLRRNHG